MKMVLREWYSCFKYTYQYDIEFCSCMDMVCNRYLVKKRNSVEGEEGGGEGLIGP